MGRRLHGLYSRLPRWLWSLCKCDRWFRLVLGCHAPIYAQGFFFFSRRHWVLTIAYHTLLYLPGIAFHAPRRPLQHPWSEQSQCSRQFWTVASNFAEISIFPWSQHVSGDTNWSGYIPLQRLYQRWWHDRSHFALILFIYFYPHRLDSTWIHDRLDTINNRLWGKKRFRDSIPTTSIVET